MRIGLHTLSSPVNQYPDGSAHPAPYDWTLFKFDLARPPALAPANRAAWVSAIKAAGRTPIVGLDPAVPTDTNYDAQYFEIGNEMNYGSMPPATYAAALKTMYAAIKAARPSAQVILGGTDSWQNGGGAQKWIAKMMVALDGASPFDIFGVHLYPHGPPSEIDRIPEMIGNIRATLWAWRLETKPVWCTEFGILKDTARFRDMPRVVQRDWITRMMGYAKAGGCEAAVWYAADQHDMGLGTGTTELADSVALWNSL